MKSFEIRCDICGEATQLDGEGIPRGWRSARLSAGRLILGDYDLCPECFSAAKSSEVLIAVEPELEAAEVEPQPEKPRRGRKPKLVEPPAAAASAPQLAWRRSEGEHGKDDYVLDSGDGLEIRVFWAPELAWSCTISEDGEVTAHESGLETERKAMAWSHREIMRKSKEDTSERSETSL